MPTDPLPPSQHHRPRTVARAGRSTCQPVTGSLRMVGLGSPSPCPHPFDMRTMGARCDRCPNDVTPSTGSMRRPRPSTNSTGVSGTVARPVFHNATNCILDSSVVPWKTCLPCVNRNTIFFANTGLPRQIDLGMRVVASPRHRSRHPELPAIAPDPSTARSARRLLRWTYQRLPTLPTRGR